MLDDPSPGAAIKAIKEQVRRIPQRGIGYGILRYLQSAPEAQALAIDPAVIFNYLGQFDQSTRGPLINGFATASSGIARTPAGQRAHLLEITAIVVGGELQVEWVYSRHYHQARTIQQLADYFTAALQRLLTHCQEPTAGGYTPSDFPDTTLSPAALDGLLAAIANANRGAPDTVQWLNQQIEAIYPLSPSQQGMLLETLARTGSGLHIEQTVFDWQGPLQVTAFIDAWQRVNARHAPLRTGFAWAGLDEPLQFVLRQAPMPIARYSLTDHPAAEQQAKIEQYVTAERQRGFDMGRAPLLRLAIFQLADHLHRIVWTRHHILTDGWSLPLMMNEVMAFYQADCRGETLHLRPSPTYQSYIAWLRRQSVAASEAFWRQQLADFTAPTPLATKMAPDETKGYGAAAAALSTTATTALMALSRQYGLTTNTLVQAGWTVLLHHYSNTDDVLFGATVSGRPPEVADVEAIVGLFINSVPVRIKLTPVGDGSLLAWLQMIQTQNLAQQSHAYCSAGQIHQWSAVPAALPLYESLLVFENYPIAAGSAEAGALDQAQFTLRDAGSVGAQTSHALTLLVLPGKELRFHVVYDTTRFTASDLQQLLAHLVALLTALPNASEQPLRTFIQSDAHFPTVYPLQKQTDSVAFVAPRTETEQHLAEVWQAALGLPTIGVDDSFFALGGHSLVAIRLMAQIQQHFAMHLPLATLFQYPTIAQLAKRLTTLTTSEGADWSALVPIQPQGTKLPFFCAAGAGGYGFYLHELARSLGADQPFYGLQSVGLDGETPPYGTIEAMAAHYIREIQRVQPSGPYLLGGHSFGGKVVFEMARQLGQAGEMVACLAMVDTTAPTPRPLTVRETWDDAQWAFVLAGVVSELLGVPPPLTHAELQALTPEAQLYRLKTAFEQLGFLPVGATLNPVRGLLQVLKSNMSVKYAPTARLPVPITLFRATEELPTEVFVDPEEARLRQTPTFGWAQFTQFPVEVIRVPGSHATMTARPHVAALARQLQARLSGFHESLVVQNAQIRN